jgi:hypothetical protein
VSDPFSDDRADDRILADLNWLIRLEEELPLKFLKIPLRRERCQLIGCQSGELLRGLFQIEAKLEAGRKKPMEFRGDCL